MKAPVSEIYSSVQGEGPYTGEKQIFFRLAGCPLRCDYCDTPNSLTAQGHNLMDVNDAFQEIMRQSIEHQVKTVSITGGEPLVHVSYLQKLLPKLRASKMKIYLETAGIHPKQLSQIIDLCDVVSMDIKLPSATGEKNWAAHKEFLQIGGEKVFTKVVIESHSKFSEIDEMLRVISNRTHPPTLVLQPVTPGNSSVQAPSPEMVSQVYRRAKAKIPEVLVMTQKHKEWGIR